MKKVLTIVGLAVLALVVIVGALYTYNTLVPVSYGSTDFNVLGGTLTTSATSTGSYGDGSIPVKVLDGDTSRQYAAFSNPSDTTMYLYFNQTVLDVTGVGSATAVTSTITDLSGVSIAAGGMYEITNQNLITGFVYASSTGGVTKKQINVSYK